MSQHLNAKGLLKLATIVYKDDSDLVHQHILLQSAFSTLLPTIAWPLVYSYKRVLGTTLVWAELPLIHAIHFTVVSFISCLLNAPTS